MPRRINPQQQKRTSLARAFTKFTLQYAEIVDRSHDVLLIQEKSRLGIWIGFTLNRHVELIERLARDYFKGFEKHEYISGDRAWVRFGYDYDGRVPKEVIEATPKFKKATAS